MTTAVSYSPTNDLEVHIIPKSKEIKIELLETDDEILDFYKELSDYYSKNNN
ncbi:Uncharacterised protein [Mycoplasmopsis maculosa]|uniref:Uncharacterized protein n=1 Tax=Mycoplasmopsis maculosa TaxID=114885 RepID=A0A449B593_9BACT|nr:hypothetical protein [Mycoplasmopsis maculosa]VEU75739.1 Uncharacterised protein [Mycoplasmopsis maculosa]